MGWIAVAIGLGSGCASPLGTISLWTTGGWHTEYRVAQGLSARTARPMLVHFTDRKPQHPDPTLALFSKPTVRERTEAFVRCRLYRECESDRRFAAQYGVRRAPAFILIHPDGTYHARSGTMSAEDVTAFLDQAVPPGRSPEINPFLPPPTCPG